ncbi:GntR family transcriptional regulator [Streptomyces sp. S.PB5]|uniref:GntR family transcriptional regulator n=1 Tax=Streptomyces sp. S.PB5 TaxID=3020844 RepID=UPI0025AF76C6|nr:GntR family transcriptional regulator [Streptomyces sp. S.PB5]MDN3028757.1 GntR family transcriptional regulator [Streptomyces sp. S.PB5]
MDARESSGSGAKEFQRVAQALRTRIADGTYPLSSYLPPQRELVTEFGVSRDTIQRALRDLAEEELILSRQGSGSRVLKVPPVQSSAPTVAGLRRGVDLRRVISSAFEAREVTMDVYTLTSESLQAHLYFQVERIYAREITPERIALRLLLPDAGVPLPYPRVKGDKEDQRLQERLRAMSRRHTASLRGSFNDLRTQGLVPIVDLEIRHTPMVPPFKLYLMNGVEALHGMYNVIERQIELADGEVVTALDVLGVSATMTHHVKDEDAYSPGSVFVGSMQAWFNSVWTNLSE